MANMTLILTVTTMTASRTEKFHDGNAAIAALNKANSEPMTKDVRLVNIVRTPDGRDEEQLVWEVLSDLPRWITGAGKKEPELTWYQEGVYTIADTPTGHLGGRFVLFPDNGYYQILYDTYGIGREPSLKEAQTRALEYHRTILASRDLHRERAAKEFGVAYEDVTPEQRARAKELNFITAYTPDLKRGKSDA